VRGPEAAQPLAASGAGMGRSTRRTVFGGP
jgi:hypothetical protein